MQTDDNMLGIPVGRKTATLPEPARPQSAREPELRPGETELGRPTNIPHDLRLLTDEDRKRIQIEDEAQAVRELAEAEELLASDPEVFGWLGFLSHPVAFAFLIGMAAILALFLYAQAMSVLGSLAMQPAWAQTVGYTGLALLGFCVLYAAVRLGILYYQLRRNRQIRLAGLQELANRTRLRWLADAKTTEAKTQLEEYMRLFPIGSDKQRKSLAKIGISDDRVRALEVARETLLDPAKFASSGQWFGQFRETFQKSLDDAAAERIAYWSKRAGVINATAPNGLIDSLATTFFGFALLADLCRIYNLRAGRTGTAVLLGRVFFNAYLTGQLTELEKLTEDQVDQMMGEFAAARVLSKVGTRIGGGVLAYFLLKRLGKYACRLLRPVA